MQLYPLYVLSSKLPSTARSRPCGGLGALRNLFAAYQEPGQGEPLLLPLQAQALAESSLDCAAFVMSASSGDERISLQVSQSLPTHSNIEENPCTETWRMVLSR